VRLWPLACWDWGVRILPWAWMFATGTRCVLSGTGLCDGLITRPEDSYHCDLETSTMRRQRATRVVEPWEKILQDNPIEIMWWTFGTVGGKPKCSHWQPA